MKVQLSLKDCVVVENKINDDLQADKRINFNIRLLMIY